MKTISFTITIIFIVLIIVSFFFFGNNSENNTTAKNSISGKTIVEKNNNKNSDAAQNTQQSSSSEQNSQTENSQQQSSNSPPGCVIKQIAYSLTNLKKTSTCNSFNENICVDKKVKCTLDVRNLDDSLSGNFEIKFTYYDSVNQQDVLRENIITNYITAQTTTLFESTVNFQNTNANKDISCLYASVEIPNNEFC